MHGHDASVACGSGRLAQQLLQAARGGCPHMGSGTPASFAIMLGTHPCHSRLA